MQPAVSKTYYFLNYFSKSAINTTFKKISKQGKGLIKILQNQKLWNSLTSKINVYQNEETQKTETCTTVHVKRP